MAGAGPGALETGVSITTLGQGVVFLAPREADGAIVLVGALDVGADTTGTGREAVAVLGGILPHAGVGATRLRGADEGSTVSD